MWKHTKKFNKYKTEPIILEVLWVLKTLKTEPIKFLNPEFVFGFSNNDLHPNSTVSC